MKKNVADKPKRKKWPILAAVVVLLLVLVLAVSGGSSSTPSAAEDTGTPEETSTPEDTGGADAVSVEFGELLELNDNREYAGVVVVKAKITPNLTNEMTINQNYYNAVDLIQNQGFDGCEFQYWAVADMTDGKEGKVISFTVPQDVVDRVAAGGVTALQLPDLVTDLWILPSLQN